MNEQDKYDENYRQSIKNDVESGRFFKDAWDYWVVRYLSDISNRTFYTFMGFMGILITYYVITLSSYVFPLKEDIYITIKENDLTKYQTNIVDLSLYKNTESSDEQLLRYLLENYVKERESHNYKSGNVADFNNKLQKIRNTSSNDVYEEFKRFMSRNNKNGPFYWFGKNISSNVEIKNFKFYRTQKKKISEKIIDFFTINTKLPIKADVYYNLITDTSENKNTSRRKATINFKYSSLEYDREKEEYRPVKVIITDYKNYLLK